MKDLQKMGLLELDSDTQRKTNGGGIWILPIANLSDTLRAFNTVVQGILDAYETI